MIKHTTRINDQTKPKAQDLGIQIIFFALNFLAVPFSGYQTYMGYRDVAGGEIMAIVLAGLSSLLFFGLNYIIMDRRKNGMPHLVQTLGYILPLGISFFGNFNSFYCNSTSCDLQVLSVNNYTGVLEKTKSDGIAALLLSTENAQRSADKNILLIDLKQQIENGWGKNCKDLWDKLQKITPTSEPQDENEMASCKANKNLCWKLYEYREKWFNNAFEADSIGRYNKVKPAITEINALYDTLKPSIDYFKSLSCISNGAKKTKEGLRLTDDVRKTNNDIADIVRVKINDFNYTPLATSDDSGVCTIKHSLESAYVRWDFPTATFFATFFSLIIDLITLGFVFLAIPYDNKRRPNYQGPRPL